MSFLDVIQAIEGTASLFDCSFDHGPQCPNQRIILQGENKMENYFRNMTLADLAKEIQ
ncbi:Rrf2 family transcriptional regulator [Paenibacillus sp. 453mf]|uniref:Rrf2 family transcriptional regulator n=1 Tax=Paenibacillus sp. 453mf TaxID=1761874 RepID=UPI00244EDED2|nr:Rrf2 family transcriptional regulator [Paenibacillus sp. 453mf]